MACNHRHGTPTDPEAPCYKCKDADAEVAATCQPFLKSAIGRYADRRHELDERQRLLGERIAIMERSLPAAMAFGMCNSGGSSDVEATAIDRVREMLRSEEPDPADELVAELAARVEQLNRETAELHVRHCAFGLVLEAVRGLPRAETERKDKIINADVELEESCMELESLELANSELEEQIQLLEGKLTAQDSLESIGSDDRACLARIRELGTNEIRLKRCISELEERETLLRCQIEKILSAGTRDESRCKRLCGAVQGQRHHVHRSKSRRKKECQKLGESKEPIFERNKSCGKTGCETLDKLVEQKRPLSCKCQKHKVESTYKKTESCKHLAQKCCCQPRKKSKKLSSSRLCNCNKPSKNKSEKRIYESVDSPWCTPDVASLTPLHKTEAKTSRNPCEESDADFVKCACSDDPWSTPAVASSTPLHKTEEKTYRNPCEKSDDDFAKCACSDDPWSTSDVASSTPLHKTEEKTYQNPCEKSDADFAKCACSDESI